MKKLAIITAILLIAATAFSQSDRRERDKQVQNHRKSETTARRSIDQPVNVTTSRSTSTSRPSGVIRTQATNKSTRTNRTSTTSRPSGVSRSKPVTGNSGMTREVRKPADERGTQVRYTTGADRNKQVRKPSGSVEHQRSHYRTPNRNHVRKPQGVTNHSIKYRTLNHQHYRAPSHVHVTWTSRMYHEYRIMYPDFQYWYYPVGYRIVTVPAYNAYFHIGEVRNVYGMVHEVWYSFETDDYYLYFGGTYPRQDFTVILPGRSARRFDRYPEAFFTGRYMWVTGLVSTFDGRPEIMVMNRQQVHLY